MLVAGVAASEARRLAPIAPPRSPSCAGANAGGSSKKTWAHAAPFDPAEPRRAAALAEPAAHHDELHVEERDGRPDRRAERVDGLVDQIARDAVAGR